MNTENDEKPDFEQSLSELENLVSQLETGDLSLDQSLQCFKRGVELTRLCQSILDQAQQTVELLTLPESSTGQTSVEKPD